jgi:DNA modification methylase
MLIRADARHLPLVDGCVQMVVTSPPYWGLRDYGAEGQIGMELTPAEYTSNIVAVFAELWRVLKSDGTAWLNLGDCYANDGKWGGETGGKQAYLDDNDRKCVGREKRVTGLKAKDMVGIPWRVAFALQSAGWYLRSDIVWSKPNPMPESITDRPTKAHEYIFLLTKNERYYYDADAIKEPYAESTLREIAEGYKGEATKDYDAAGVQNPSDTKRRIIENARKKNEASGDRRRARVNDWDKRDNDRVIAQNNLRANARAAGDTRADYNFQNGIGRNKRTVWHVPTQPYPDSHFATFPEALIEPCILAGSRPGDLVLDPFIGSGTTGAVCDRLMRRWVGTDLSYQHLAKKRTAQRGLRLELGA